MKLKKILLLLGALLVFLPVFAEEVEEVESVGLTDSDMKNFIKNYSQIDAELEKLNYNMDSINDSQTDAEKVEILEQLFRKYGISGSSAFAKVILIHTDFLIEHYDRGINSDPLTRAIVKKSKRGSRSFCRNAKFSQLSRLCPCKKILFRTLRCFWRTGLRRV